MYTLAVTIAKKIHHRPPGPNTSDMQCLSIEPFVPSGSNFELAKDFFQQLGFNLNWDAGDYVGFENNGCRFILQHFNNKGFAENFMLSVKIPDAEAFYQQVLEKRLPQQFSIRITKPTRQPYGLEVNLIDMAGVCWHFVE